MRRFLYLLAILISTAIPASAQYTPPALDSLSGYMTIPCTDPNTAFNIVLIGNQKLFCEADGHAFFSRGFYVMDPCSSGSVDEAGGSTSTYCNFMYGSAANARIQAVKQVQFWGMNSLPPFENVAMKAPANPPIKLPFVGLMFSSEYCLINKLGWGTGACPDLMHFVKTSEGAVTNWHGATPSGVADWRSPNWLGMVNGIMANDSGFQALAAASTANKQYLIGVSLDESDGTHGQGAGPNFATRPAGNNDFALGYLAFFIPPVNWSNSHQGQLYPDGAIYMKARWQTLLIAEYGTLAALNTAWGSSYTTFGSSGLCVGQSVFPITCATAAAAPVIIGTGNGSTLTFSNTLVNTTVSKYSVGIFVNGVLVGGDTGAGALYGPTLSGSVNYLTGAITATFSSGHAPANGINITAAYIQNGFGIGSGFMDEDCRTVHASYCGNGSNNTTIYFCSTPPSTGCLPTNVQADINALSKDSVQYYASTGKTAVNNWGAAHGFTGNILMFGATTAGTWGTPSSCPVLQGLAAGGQDVYLYGGEGEFTQAELDFVNSCAPGMPIIPGSYRTANADSPFAWPNSPCTHSSTTVTCTLQTPTNFTTSKGIQAICNNPDYAPTGIFNLSSISSGVATYTKSPAPTEAAATCNLFWTDINEGGLISQAARATDFFNNISILPSMCYTGGVCPHVGYYWWAFDDSETEKLNWGPRTLRGNAYDGHEDVNASVTCSPPLNSFTTCGNELRGPYGSATIAAIEATNTAIDNALLGLSPTSPPAPAPFFALNFPLTSSHTGCPAKCGVITYCIAGDGAWLFDASCSWKQYPTGVIPTTATLPAQTLTLH